MPAIEDITTNALPGFPFDSVYDFISEINRPVDKTTMSSLRFRFSIADLKFDVEKVKKKKDPQEIVDGINCKLTRLAVWRDALQAVSDGPDMFTEEAQWAEKVKGRFQSMRALMQAGDPAKLLDSQYDKKATFLRIIDQWSDRLKRNFKYIYQSQREPEDFALQVLRSDWRVDLADTAAALSRAPLLDLGGPAFTPGSLQPLFEERAWPPDYAAAEALHEMLVWQRLANKVRMAADLPPSTVTRMAFVRGRTTERLLVDTFAGVEGWLRGGAADVFVRRAVMYELGLHAEAAEDDLDHTERWAACVSDLDDYVRTQSAAESRGVKDMFRGWIAEGKAFLDWFTALVRDLDLVDKVRCVLPCVGLVTLSADGESVARARASLVGAHRGAAGRRAAERGGTRQRERGGRRGQSGSVAPLQARAQARRVPGPEHALAQTRRQGQGGGGGAGRAR